MDLVVWNASLRTLSTHLSISCSACHTQGYWKELPSLPTGSDGDCLPLASSEGERIDLVVNPPFPLSFGRPLYLHAGICFEDNGFDLSSAGDPADVQYRLDEESFRLFCGATRASLQKRDDLLFLNKKKRRISGGDDPVEDSWDSWSGRSERETLHDPKAFAFQRVPFAELNLPLEPPTIYNELRLFRQLTNDFSWAGVTPTVAWVERVMDNANKQEFFDVPVVRKEWLPLFELPRLSGDLLEAARAVHSMRIPYDGDPLPETDVVEDQFAWDDEPDPMFDYQPFVQPAVALGNVKIIVFDLYGTIFDRERVIRDVLESLTAPKARRFTSDDLYRLYTTYESYRSREHSSTADLIRGALNDVAEHLGLSINDEAVVTALNQVSHPPLYPDVLPAVEVLHNRGLKLLCMSPVDPAFSDAIQSSLPRGMTIVPTTYIYSRRHSSGSGSAR
ncbi:2-haloalkanoic acid dehalogenase [Grifola frondosa]|uniref:2-haloalkanoic acid dehalogenase n=1 Tax=Grifola frondosa TaxID=5627 RepID=A0A1C7LMV2_GRIFR|nr:2-haloalkanoic acid dehalogenase [Grifola frondosa]